MKKKSLAALEASGWKLPPDEQKRSDRHKLARQADANTNRIVRAVDAMKTVANGQSTRLETLVAEQTQAIGKLTESLLAQRSTGWEFDVHRNKGGFISKVYAKRSN